MLEIPWHKLRRLGPPGGRGFFKNFRQGGPYPFAPYRWCCSYVRGCFRTLLIKFAPSQQYFFLCRRHSCVVLGIFSTWFFSFFHAFAAVIVRIYPPVTEQCQRLSIGRSSNISLQWLLHD